MEETSYGHEQTFVEKMADILFLKPPKVEGSYAVGAAGAQLLNNGAFYYLWEGQRVVQAHSKACTLDGRRIDTRSAVCRQTEITDVTDELGSGKRIRAWFEENDLQLQRDIVLHEGGEITVQLFLRERKQSCVRTRYLAPVDLLPPDGSGMPLFRSLDQKMLLVPYDNDMWVRYESCPPRPGRTSYDVTAIYDERTYEGLVLGAVDFDVWKNAICCSAQDARAFTAFCGAADACTHDVMPHGVVSGETVASARFVMFRSGNIKRGMERFATICTRIRKPRPWQGKAIFGWNSYSALGMGTRLANWKEAGDFLYKQLPSFCDEDGVTYINLDSAFFLSRKEIRRTVEELHERGQKAGWYAAPCLAISLLNSIPVSGMVAPLNKLTLKDDRGEPLPKIDNNTALDVTHPLWERHARALIKSLVDLDLDYIKLDFLSHGSLEGCHYRKDYTGRMALNHAYKILEDEINKAQREIFVCLSIAPLFPYYLGNARRSCCDSFGHGEDVRYVLNALNFSWWTNGTLYRYNDPDHLALYHSVVDGRPVTSEAEARSRYNSGVISGTLMILSDNYGPSSDSEFTQAARARTKRIADNPGLNALARLGKSFVPVELRSDTTPFYTLEYDGRFYAAVFNFEAERRTLGFYAPQGGLPEKGWAVSLHDGSRFSYSGEFTVTLDGFDSAIFEITNSSC